MTEFAWWQAALKGTRGPISADEPESGFYRQKRKDGSFEPVAYWKDSADGSQRCHINGQEPRDPLRAFEVWPHASKNPITEDAYWHRMDTGQWLDNDAGAAAAAKGPDIDPASDPVGSMRAEIEKARAGLSAYKAIDSDEQAAKGQTLRSALTALAGKAEKERKRLKQPHLDAGKAVDDAWMPLTKTAQDGANDIREALEAWETIKLENQRRADQENRKREEAARQEQEWQAAAPPGSVPDQTAPPPIERVAPNTPAPAMQIKGASGRAASVGTKKVVDAIDLDKAFEQFRNLPQVYTFFLDLAQRAVDAGRDVPGATITEKATVK